MRFHVVGLPHTVVDKAWSNDAYNIKTYRFSQMLHQRGHEVFLYAAQASTAPCTELVECISRDEQRELIGIEGPEDNLKADFDVTKPYWRLMDGRAIDGIKARAKPQDYLCLIAGRCQEPVARALPNLMAVEYGIGYGGCFAPYRVFESYAWMHTVYGAQTGGDPHKADGRYYDAVIPNYYDPADFPFSASKDDYYLFIGRLIERKGWRVAQEVCQRLGARLVVAGQGTFDGYGEYVGLVGPDERGKLMSRARAIFVPTQYVEPFGGVHAEAMLCGTPVICTDWGVFPETIVNGVNGYRCRTLQQFLDAAATVGSLDPAKIHFMARDRFSLEAVAPQYEAYFGRLSTLFGAGWYEVD